MQYDIYVIMFRPPFSDKYYSTKAFNTLEDADIYIFENSELNPDAYYVAVITVN